MQLLHKDFSISAPGGVVLPRSSTFGYVVYAYRIASASASLWAWAKTFGTSVSVAIEGLGALEAGKPCAESVSPNGINGSGPCELFRIGPGYSLDIASIGGELAGRVSYYELPGTLPVGGKKSTPRGRRRLVKTEIRTESAPIEAVELRDAPVVVPEDLRKIPDVLPSLPPTSMLSSAIGEEGVDVQVFGRSELTALMESLDIQSYWAAYWAQCSCRERIEEQNNILLAMIASLYGIDFE